MNKLLVLAKNKETYFIKKLIKEVGQSSVLLYDPWTDRAPTGFNKILVRTTGVYRSELDLVFLRQAQVPILNPLNSLEIFRSKSSQYKFFNSGGHPCPSWCDLSHQDFLNWDTDSFLVKPDFGQGGWGIEVFNRHQLSTWIQTKKLSGDLSWIIQPYLKSPEFRVFFVGEERFCLKREGNYDQVAANFASDGIAQLIELPDHLHKIVDNLITNSGAYYGAIDLLDHPSGPVILELNVVPGIEQLETLTSQNIMRILVSAKYFCQSA